METSPGRDKRCWHALLHQLQSINLIAIVFLRKVAARDNGGGFFRTLLHSDRGAVYGESSALLKSVKRPFSNLMRYSDGPGCLSGNGSKLSEISTRPSPCSTSLCMYELLNTTSTSADSAGTSSLCSSSKG